MSEVTTLINNRMKPIIAMECSLPWDVVRMLDEREEDREFLGPFSVRENADHTQPDSKLFCVRFRCENQKIKVYLQSTQHPGTCDLLAAAHLIVTHRDPEDSFDPKTWPLPNDIKDSFMFPAEGVRARVLFSCSKSRLRCLTLRLQVYAYKAYPADSLIDFLNSSRKSGSLLCDIRLQVDGQDFPAHKAVLSASSCVFMAMFTADFKEKSSETIVIENVSKEAFGRFLEILYSDLDTGLVGYELELLELSERFQVAWLKDSCKMYMWDLDGPSALRILMQADKWPVVTPGLIKRLCQLVAASYRSLEDTDDWRALQASNPVASGFIQAFATAVTPPMVMHFNTVPPSGKISRKRPLSS